MPTVTQVVACAAVLTTAAVISHVMPADAGVATVAGGWLLRMLSSVAWVFAISVWHVEAQKRVAREQHKQLIRKVRTLCRRIGTVEDRVNELSNDRAQAAAAVTSLFKDRAPRN